MHIEVHSPVKCRFVNETRLLCSLQQCAFYCRTLRMQRCDDNADRALEQLYNRLRVVASNFHGRCGGHVSLIGLPRQSGLTRRDYLEEC